MSASTAGPWTVAIPAPAPWLSANQRRDLRRQTPDRRAWRDAGMVHAKRARLPRLQYAHLVAVLRFPDNRRRDAHNYYPTLKALVDGLVDYGLLPDDSDNHLVGPDLRRGPALKVGYGEVVLTVADLAREGDR
jgi:crossover junction endodeoxyribonuclease RusA